MNRFEIEQPIRDQCLKSIARQFSRYEAGAITTQEFLNHCEGVYKDALTLLGVERISVKFNREVE